MTDQFEPTTQGPTPDPDATSRIPTPAAPLAPDAPTAATPAPPTAPLTPASRASSAPTSYDHETAWSSGPVPASPVVPPAKPPRRGGRLRWAVSIVVVALVIATSAAVAAVITGRSSNATVLGYVPDGTTAYSEVRLDLPGDQRRAVGEFLQKFPGFADQASLDSKLDQVLDDLVKDATNDEQTYTGNIKPWFGGELAFSLGALPSPSAISGGDESSIGSLRALVLISVTDPAAAQTWINAEIAKTGAKTTTETYGGTTLTVFEKTDGVTPALAVVDGKVAVAGDIISVKAAVDSKGSGGFASSAGPKAALDAASDDHVAFSYVALGPLLDWSDKLDASMLSVSANALSETMRKSIPDWGASWLRFEGDALVMEAAAPKPEVALGPTANRSSAIAEHVPASAIVASTTNDFGKTVKQALDLYRTEPAYKSAIEQLDQALGLVGGADAAIGWVGDTALVINNADGTPEAGVIVAPTDQAAAEHLFTSLRTFIALGGSQQGITLKDETYNGTTITTVDVGDLSALSGMGSSGAASMLPIPSGNLQIAYAVTDDVVVIGTGPGFVKHVLDTTKDTSLASSDRYKKLIDRAGAGTGTAFVDITAIRGMIEKAVAGSADAAGLAKYETDIKPFLAPFDALVASNATGDLNRTVIYITVK